MHGKIALITGGGSGIGLAVGHALAARGVKVVLADRNAQAAEQAAGSIRSTGGQATAVPLDVTNREAVFAVVTRTAQTEGRLDYLFNNAGIAIDGEFQDLSLDHWQKVMNVNFWGVLHGCQAAYPIMQRQGFGHIINTASLAGLIPGGLTSLYCASKHAVVGLTLSLRAEARCYGVKVSALCPGYIATPIHATTPMVTAYMNAEKNRALAASMKLLTAEQCAPAILRGVARNRGIVFVPLRQKPYWLLHRLNPEIIPHFFTSIIKRMKRNAH